MSLSILFRIARKYFLRYNLTMEAKRRPGRPLGSLNRERKGADNITLRLAQDCRAIVDGLVPRAYPTRTAAIEALIRLANRRLNELGVQA